MATNKYRVLLQYGDREVPEDFEADGYRVKDDGWIHFYVDGPTPDAPKETILSFSPKSVVLRITKRDQVAERNVLGIEQELHAVAERIIARLESAKGAEENFVACTHGPTALNAAIRIVREECGVAE